jgi:hypothetical protein
MELICLMIARNWKEDEMKIKKPSIVEMEGCGELYCKKFNKNCPHLDKHIERWNCEFKCIKTNKKCKPAKKKAGKK